MSEKINIDKKQVFDSSVERMGMYEFLMKGRRHFQQNNTIRFKMCVNKGFRTPPSNNFSGFFLLNYS